MHLEPTHDQHQHDRVARRSAMERLLAASDEIEAAQAVPPPRLGESLTRDMDALREACDEIETHARRARELVAQAEALADHGGAGRQRARLHVV